MIAKNRGSKRLVGAPSLRKRMPAVDGSSAHLEIAQWIEQQPHKLWVTGSTPVFRQPSFKR